MQHTKSSHTTSLPHATSPVCDVAFTCVTAFCKLNTTSPSHATSPLATSPSTTTSPSPFLNNCNQLHVVLHRSQSLPSMLAATSNSPPSAAEAATNSLPRQQQQPPPIYRSNAGGGSQHVTCNIRSLHIRRLRHTQHRLYATSPSPTTSPSHI